MSVRARLETPEEFRYPGTVHAYGWASLPPFRYDAASGAIESVVVLPGGGARRVRISRGDGAVFVESPGRSNRHITAAARRMLNLDLDLSDFYRRVREHPQWAWIADVGAGRLLRCPTAFEDLVKLVLTTNCSWAFTTRMVHALVALHGEQAPDGSRSFPTPEALARVGERSLRDRVRAGYRAPMLAALACSVADGEVDPESWERDLRDSEELKRELLALPGVGPYVAENMLRFLGRPVGLGLDSWLRSEFARIHHGGRRVTDRTIARRYARLGRWSGLTLWCEMTRGWYSVDPPGSV